MLTGPVNRAVEKLLELVNVNNCNVLPLPFIGVPMKKLLGL